MSLITYLINVFIINTTYTHAHLLQPTNNDTVYGALKIQLDTIFTMIYTYIHMHICFNHKIKGYDACIYNNGIHRLTPLPSKVVQGFTPFLGSQESIAKVKVASNVQCQNPVLLVLSENSYRLIVLGHIPSVLLIPFGNVNDKKNTFPDLPFSATQSLGKYGHPLPCSHSPSMFPGIPYLGRSIPW